MPPHESTESTSTIGAGTVVRGSVHGDGDLEILGRVEGDVHVRGDLSIGETALIKSDVRGRRVTVRGAIAGNVSATEALVLEAGARVVGDLAAPQIGIRPGALLRGLVSTGAPPAAAAATPAAATRAQPARAATPPRAAVPARIATVSSSSSPARAAAPAAARAARPEPARVEPAEVARPEPVRVAEPDPPASRDDDDRAEEEANAEQGGPPLPIVPQIRKGAKASLKRKTTR
jgi:cytoskeletal protein CcmA (bactofilin family)